MQTKILSPACVLCSDPQEVQDRFVDELSVEVKEDIPGAEDEERMEEVGGSDSHASTDHALDEK